ncbi:ABC-type nitrate/sulfonate/bicarbonate transport system, permease component [Micromonospora rhizosphaerae]|uniref:ABC-type nitrate/sulfonate/bicarbonate transport system, permease component n=1 Tax=Micromonospora rhizosphaerae TaxID=568872 RepID=A0A1C6SW81_9ACTN|nr:ABC transporter permease [Micromonospora rhizosphaerae]SCL33768.1 ABC-type nitrate/sulfonate/bicarbonate transport system, permease component [Micromonospora rhizosphaerae]
MTSTTTLAAPARKSRAGAAGRLLGGSALLGVLGFATFVALLEVVPRIGLVSPDYLPPASRIGVALAELVGEASFWTALGDTVRGWFLGLVIAVVLGIAVGFVIGTVPVLREFTASTIEFLRPIPSVALIPLAVLVFGTDLRSVLLLVVYASFWQVLVQVLYGVQDVDPVAQETARTFGLDRWARMRHVTWPTALPYVLTGVRLAAAVALILAITAELIIGAPGLGNEIGVAQSGGAIPRMYALVIVTGLLGVAVNVLARRLERWLLSWHPSLRREVAA